MYGHTEDILKEKESSQERSSIIYGVQMDLASLPAKTEAWLCKSGKFLVVTEKFSPQPWYCLYCMHGARAYIALKFTILFKLTISAVENMWTLWNTVYLCSWAHPQWHTTRAFHSRGFQLRSYSRYFVSFYPDCTDTCLHFLRQILHSIYMIY